MTFTNCKRGRVVAAFRELFLVELDSTKEMIKAKLSGRFLYQHEKQVDYPTVGDWVNLDTENRIFCIHPRKTVLERGDCKGGGKQILASNIDVVFITTSLNRNLNYNRIDRFLIMVQASGAKAILLFTKKDLIDEFSLQELKGELDERYPQLEKIFVSKNDSLSESALQENLIKLVGENTVWALVGSSGVGKSTFINLILGGDHILTREIREDDDRGRHTTTHRQMYQTSLGVWIIDSPGIRELDVEVEDEVVETFSDIRELMKCCRFSDCQHETEPNCAIKDALVSGSLNASRWISFQKIYGRKTYDLRKLTHQEKTKIREGWKRQSLRRRKDEKLKKHLLSSR